MKIKDYTCSCGKNDFFFADKGNQKGIYCAYCGKWFKWADKNEQNLAMKQEPQSSSEKPDKWIPCSERLPEDLDKKYLVTVELTFARKNTYVSIKQGKSWEESKSFGHEIIAWMPLPQPYKQEVEK